jgi:hypothetical protein
MIIGPEPYIQQPYASLLVIERIADGGARKCHRGFVPFSMTVVPTTTKLTNCSERMLGKEEVTFQAVQCWLSIQVSIAHDPSSQRRVETLISKQSSLL